jgi:hypothetical protein
MEKPKRQLHTRRFWESLTDEQILETELMTDDPESLEGLVFEVPPGDEETYVEFKYDLRGSGRDEEFTCVHGHHKHLAGFVMRKGKARFMVGWICGGTIYGEDFDQYTADFDAAVNRQEGLRRARVIRDATEPFLVWLTQISKAEVFNQYARVEDQFAERMPWIWDNLPAIARLDKGVLGVELPRTLFGDDTDPGDDFAKIVSEFGSLALMLVASAQAEKTIGQLKRRMESVVDRIERVFDQLKELEDLFQPAALTALCKFATENDNPKRRTYVAGLGSITCRRDKPPVTIQMPRNYRIPDRAMLTSFRGALAGLAIK